MRSPSFDTTVIAKRIFGEWLRADRSVRRSRSGNENRDRPIVVREETFQILDLRQVVVDDVRIAWMTCQEVLMIVLGSVEFPVRLDLGDDRGFVDARLVQLGNIGLGDSGLFGARR